MRKAPQVAGGGGINAGKRLFIGMLVLLAVCGAALALIVQPAAEAADATIVRRKCWLHPVTVVPVVRAHFMSENDGASTYALFHTHALVRPAPRGAPQAAGMGVSSAGEGPRRPVGQPVRAGRAQSRGGVGPRRPGAAAASSTPWELLGRPPPGCARAPASRRGDGASKYACAKPSRRATGKTPPSTLPSSRRWHADNRLAPARRWGPWRPRSRHARPAARWQQRAAKLGGLAPIGGLAWKA